MEDDALYAQQVANVHIVHKGVQGLRQVLLLIGRQVHQVDAVNERGPDPLLCRARLVRLHLLRPVLLAPPGLGSAAEYLDRLRADILRAADRLVHAAAGLDVRSNFHRSPDLGRANRSLAHDRITLPSTAFTSSSLVTSPPTLTTASPEARSTSTLSTPSSPSRARLTRPAQISHTIPSTWRATVRAPYSAGRSPASRACGRSNSFRSMMRIYYPSSLSASRFSSARKSGWATSMSSRARWR